MTDGLEGLTPLSLRAAVEALPRRALQSLAKKQGVKANQKSDTLARQLFERFLAEAAQAGGSSEDGEAAGPAGTCGDAAPGGLSPVGEGARYSDDEETVLEDTGAARHSTLAPSPVPEGLSFNPLFAQGSSEQQEAAAGEAGHPAAQEQAGAQNSSAAAPAASRRVKLVKRKRGGGAAAGGAPTEQPRMAGGKRKASGEVPAEEEAPAAKRQARKSSGGAPGADAAKAAATKPATKPNPADTSKPAAKLAEKAALKAANGPRPAPPAKPSSAAASLGQVPPTKPASVAPGSSTSMAERARLAEEKHAARRAAALARAGKA